MRPERSAPRFAVVTCTVVEAFLDVLLRTFSLRETQELDRSSRAGSDMQWQQTGAIARFARQCTDSEMYP